MKSYKTITKTTVVVMYQTYGTFKLTMVFTSDILVIFICHYNNY